MGCRLFVGRKNFLASGRVLVWVSEWHLESDILSSCVVLVGRLNRKRCNIKELHCTFHHEVEELDIG